MKQFNSEEQIMLHTIYIFTTSVVFIIQHVQEHYTVYSRLMFISIFFLNQCHLVSRVCTIYLFFYCICMCLFSKRKCIQDACISQYVALCFLSQSHSHGLSEDLSCNGEGQRGKSVSTMQLVSVCYVLLLELHYVCGRCYFRDVRNYWNSVHLSGSV